MNKQYVTDYIKSVTIEYTDNYVRVIEDQYMINQMSNLLVTMSEEDELELKMFLEGEGKDVNSEVMNDDTDLEENFIFSDNEYGNDDIVLNDRVIMALSQQKNIRGN